MDLTKLKKLIEDNQLRTKQQPAADNAAPEAPEEKKAAPKKQPPFGDKKGAKPSDDSNPNKNKDLAPVTGSKTLTGEKPNEVDVEPGLYPPEIKEGRTAVVAFGRFNPPTVGHEQLVGLVEYFAKEAAGTAMVFLSKSHDSKKNPMVYESKLAYARYAFGNTIKEAAANDLIKLAAEICEQGYNNLIFVAGDDRVAEFSRKLNMYNGKEYNFDNIVVESAGARDPDSPAIDGVSASQLREHADAGDFDSFKRGLATGLRYFAEEIYAEVRGELNELNTQQRAKRAIIFRRNKTRVKLGRDRAIRRRAPSAALMKRSRRLAIKMMRRRILRGVKYQDLSYAQRSTVDSRLKKRKKSIGKIAKRLLPKVARAEASRKIGSRFVSPLKGGKVNEAMLMEMVNMIPEAEYEYELSAKEVKALQEKAAEHETSFDILETVFRRGIALWENIETDMTFSQYGFGRVNSFLNGGKAYDVDFDMVLEDCEAFTSTKDEDEDADKDGRIGGRERAAIDVLNKLKPAASGFHRHQRASTIHRTTAEPGKMKNAQLLRKVFEQVHGKKDIPNLDDGMGKRRYDLPQLTNFDAFHKDLTDAGHKLGHDYVKPDTLTPTQKHFNQEKVDKLKKDGWGDKGIIVSNDDYVIDGHHRWLAAHQKGEKIKARRTSLDCDALLDFVKGKPYVEKKTLDESKE